MPGVVGEGTGGYRIRPMDPASETEIELVARRMRLTFHEVLGGGRHGALLDGVAAAAGPACLCAPLRVA